MTSMGCFRCTPDRAIVANVLAGANSTSCWVHKQWAALQAHADHALESEPDALYAV